MEQYLGEIKIVSMPKPPKGWAFCNGQLLTITENAALFSLLSNIYGGDGKVNFALPNLQGRVPVCYGITPNTNTRYQLAQQGGVASVKLNGTQLPMHTHSVYANSAAGTSISPANTYFADTGSTDPDYSSEAINTVMAASALAATGASEPVPVIQPLLGINFIIALTGYYPPKP